jgi:hypothetical protein
MDWPRQEIGTRDRKGFYAACDITSIVDLVISFIMGLHDTANRDFAGGLTQLLLFRGCSDLIEVVVFIP